MDKALSYLNMVSSDNDKDSVSDMSYDKPDSKRSSSVIES